ncbi:MAG: alpha-mannosidase [Candidatus Geothermarchaeales archaeon]
MRIAIVPHIHWDREWYLPSGSYRLLLTEAMDNALRYLENGTLPTFILDGQMAVVQDYLKLRPGNQRRVERLVKEGKLLVGPWYTMPDEFLAGPEVLVRNLMLGMRMSRELGGTFKVGYLVDSFGHIAQLPQILRGFGIDSLVFQRGLGDEGEHLGSEFKFVAPDGSWVHAVFLVEGYSNGSRLGFGTAEQPMHLWRSPAGGLSVIPEEYLSEMSYDSEEAIRKIEKSLSVQSRYSRTGWGLIFAGQDHEPPNPHLAETIRKLRAKGYSVEFSNLSDYLEEVRRVGEELSVHKGELRGARYWHILSGVYSNRVYLKRENFLAENLVVNHVEPIGAFGWLLGLPHEETFFQELWRLILLNHFHDAACGSGIDEVHDENMTRSATVKLAGSTYLHRVLHYIASRVRPPSEEGETVVVVNPTAFRRTDIVRLIFPLPSGTYPLIDGAGDRTQLHAEHAEEALGQRIVSFVAEDVPPLGYKAYSLLPKPTTNLSEVRCDGTTIENRCVKVTVDPERGGAVSVLDKRTGRSFNGLNILVDERDEGDLYNYEPVGEHLTVENGSYGAEVSIHAEGPVFCTLKLSYKMEVPQAVSKGRSERKVSIPVDMYLTVSSNVPRLDIKTIIDNRAEDHRLRVRFPSGLRTDRSYAASHFYVTERSFDISSGEGWVEDPPRTHPHLGWICVSDGRLGLTIAAKGNPEYEVTDEDGASIYLTLLRAVGCLSKEGLKTRKGEAGPLLPTPKAQCKGTHSFEYSIIPHSGDWRESVREAEAFIRPLTAVVQTRREGNLEPTGSFLEVVPRTLSLTAFKVSEDASGIVVRLFNPEGHRVVARILPHFQYEKAWLTDLAEEPLMRLERGQHGELELDVGAHKIVTLKLVGSRMETKKAVVYATEGKESS